MQIQATPISVTINEGFRISGYPCRATTVLFAITIIVAAVIIDGVCARYYYYSNSIRLQNAADEAVSAGIVFLPGNPAKAFKTAHQYALLNGIRPDEIIAEKVAADGSTISIELKRGTPFYLSGAVIARSNGPITEPTWRMRQGRSQLIRARSIFRSLVRPARCTQQATVSPEAPPTETPTTIIVLRKAERRLHPDAATLQTAERFKLLAGSGQRAQLLVRLAPQAFLHPGLHCRVAEKSNFT